MYLVKYNNFDINNIKKLSDNLNCQIITTEKDYLRLDKEKIHNINFIKSELKILDSICAWLRFSNFLSSKRRSASN